MKRIVLSLTEDQSKDLSALASRQAESTGMNVTSQQVVRVLVMEAAQKAGIR